MVGKREKEKDVYLVDLFAAKPSEEQIMAHQKMFNLLRRGASEEDIQFLKKVMTKSVLSNETYFPIVFPDEGYDVSNSALDMTRGIAETEHLICCCVTNLLEKTGVDAKDVDIIITACSIFNCYPSMADIVKNNFDFRDDVEVLHLGGMGCSSNVIAPDLAARLLRQRDSHATVIVINHENVTMSVYPGSQRNFMIANCIFRAGAAAALMSSDPKYKNRSKYVLERSIRTYNTDDVSYDCMGWGLDKASVLGVYLPPFKILNQVSGKAIRQTLTKLGRDMLPLKEKLKFVIQNKILRNPPNPPNLYSCVDHIIIHPGGPAVIEGTAKGLGIDVLEKQKSSINALYHYGNTSSAGNWYSIAHTESTSGLKKGEKVMFLGLGAAFEANAAIWRALRDIHEVHDAWRHIVGDRRDEAEEVFRRYLNGEQTCWIDENCAPYNFYTSVQTELSASESNTNSSDSISVDTENASSEEMQMGISLEPTLRAERQGYLNTCR